MMHVLDFLDELPDGEDHELVRFLHNFIISYPGISAKLMFNTPFYTRNKWMIYLSRQKKGGYEICFVYANLFTQYRELLDFKKRKQVGGIAYLKAEDVDEELIDRLINEAIKIDEGMKKKK